MHAHLYTGFTPTFVIKAMVSTRFSHQNQSIDRRKGMDPFFPQIFIGLMIRSILLWLAIDDDYHWLIPMKSHVGPPRGTSQGWRSHRRWDLQASPGTNWMGWMGSDFHHIEGN